MFIKNLFSWLQLIEDDTIKADGKIITCPLAFVLQTEFVPSRAAGALGLFVGQNDSAKAAFFFLAIFESDKRESHRENSKR